jgi:hypothetical protein
VKMKDRPSHGPIGKLGPEMVRLEKMHDEDPPRNGPIESAQKRSELKKCGFTLPA